MVDKPVEQTLYSAAVPLKKRGPLQIDPLQVEYVKKIVLELIEE